MRFSSRQVHQYRARNHCIPLMHREGMPNGATFGIHDQQKEFFGQSQHGFIDSMAIRLRTGRPGSASCPAAVSGRNCRGPEGPGAGGRREVSGLQPRVPDAHRRLVVEAEGRTVPEMQVRMDLQGRPDQRLLVVVDNMRFRNAPELVPVVVAVALPRPASAPAGVEWGWSSSAPGVPLEAIVRSRTANPVILVDESGSGWSGNANLANQATALLGLLEPEYGPQLGVLPYPPALRHEPGLLDPDLERRTGNPGDAEGPLPGSFHAPAQL